METYSSQHDGNSKSLCHLKHEQLSFTQLSKAEFSSIQKSKQNWIAFLAVAGKNMVNYQSRALVSPWERKAASIYHPLQLSVLEALFLARAAIRFVAPFLCRSPAPSAKDWDLVPRCPYTGLLVEWMFYNKQETQVEKIRGCHLCSLPYLPHMVSFEGSGPLPYASTKAVIQMFWSQGDVGFKRELSLSELTLFGTELNKVKMLAHFFKAIEILVISN